MKLYYAPGACSLSPHIVASELGLKLDIEKVDLGAKKTESGADYYAINPKGYVPALTLDDGSLLTEGPAIVQYLADLAPARKLAPANGTMERYRLQEWLTFISTELHKPMGSLFAKPNAETREATLARLSLRLGFAAKTLDQQAFLMGAEPTVADFYLFVVLSWAGIVKVDLGPWPSLQKFSATIGARPAVQTALKAEGLLG